MLIYIIILLFIFILYYLHSTKSNVNFLSKYDTITFIRNDPDGYTESLTDLDIISLKSSSKQDYIQKSCDDALDFTEDQKNKLYDCCVEADSFLRSLNSFPHINGKRIASLKWNLALTNGKWYEDGYPHTRKDVIFITPSVIDTSDCTRILVHEKIHVYERLYPRDIEKWMKHMGYKVHKRFDEYPMRRSNPDLDGWVYIDPEGNETLAMFKSNNPKGINDSEYPGKKDWKFEHPYETLAYKVDYLFANETF